MIERDRRIVFTDEKLGDSSFIHEQISLDLVNSNLRVKVFLELKVLKTTKI